ncbi:glycerol-3-phosphate dehydrogenase/oxidase [Oceaniovalibus sp. ACAM 378]|uniref:glycerol-3-phosphate dehydrogenase/oxidase n=1 Tax=Oceaniovalibus sp. ACAM 378 TaxID=2599923 RepID=UPI002105C5DE|nr:glycerol-3-phosphate dehydrogenase/oxidase [Oceaniovalibus sp. ACAM 378]
MDIVTLSRSQAFKRLESLPTPDVLILGGGVNGVATLRDLALNGVSCALIDTKDFSAGASGASSRMAHGGLRYLEGREFRLVAESARERDSLIANASHLVKPLRIVVPLKYRVRGLLQAMFRFIGLSQTGGPMSLVALDGGLRIYEALGRGKNPLPRHVTFLRKSRFPTGLDPSTKAVTTYYDGQILHPEGLISEMIAEAVTVNDGCVALNHVSWTTQDGQVTVTDTVTGQSTALRPQIIINATGAWIDRVNGTLGINSNHVRLVKGAHLVLDNPALFARMDGSAYYFDDGTGRMVISLPVDRNILVGTTERDITDPEDRDVSDDEVSYLLQAMDGLFADISVTRSQVVAATSGIRPLQRGGELVTAASRDHAIKEDVVSGFKYPVLSLVGGKWTTFRAFSEQTSDRVLALLGRARKVSTAVRRYPGAGPCDAAELAQAHGLPLEHVTGLIERYGKLAKSAAAFVASRVDRPLAGAAHYSRAEIAWLIAARGAVTVEDILLRRTRLTFGLGVTQETIEDVAQIVEQETECSRQSIAAEVAGLVGNPLIYGLQER